MDYKKLTELLDAETYPHRYMHKFIGTKTDALLAAVIVLEKKFPNLSRKGERETSDSKGTCYIAFTYELIANHSGEIIELLRMTSSLPDLKIIL